MTHNLTPEELEQLDKQFIWHPFTQMSDWLAEEPLIIAGGRGSYLEDVHGRQYLDGVSSLWVTVHGHRQPDIDRAIIEQLSCIAHSTFLGLSNVPAIKLAGELVAIAPGNLRKVFYSDNGSTAVEVSLKMALQFWLQSQGPRTSKTQFISFVNGYHGDTIGSVSVGGINLFHKIYKPFLFEGIKVNSPYCYRCHLGKEYPGCQMACLPEVEEVMDRYHEQVAAIVVEPLIQGAGGMITFPQGYTRRVSELAARHDILLIADEVATGFGRTGALFACLHEGIEPDFMAVAKGITGGYLPLAATLTTQRVFDAFCGEYQEQKSFFHGHTYTANPLACAAALANLEIFRKEKTMEKLQGKIAFLKERLQNFWELKHVGDIRQMGFMVGIELVAIRDTREPYPIASKTAIRVVHEARKRGLVIRPLGDVVILMPPLSISLEELDRLLEIAYQSIKMVTQSGWSRVKSRESGAADSGLLTLDS
ncbi:MAG: L-Lysine--8-amino-7-oxononanoate transaminase [Chloroflexi bacterium]|nr:L-Lysine--8-amino-7-oxononanoate transaminase [Chloroflexota bacterium]